MDNTIVTHPEVVEVITFTLRRGGIPQDDLPDAVADVQVGFLEVLDEGNVPEDLRGAKGLAFTLAERYAVGTLRKKCVRRRRNVGLCEDPDSFTPLESFNRRDPIDVKRLLGVANELFREGKMPEGGLELLDASAAKTPRAEIAKELGISESAARDRLAKVRRLFKARLAAMGIVIALLLIAVFAVGPEIVASRPPPAPPTPPPMQVAASPVPSGPGAGKSGTDAGADGAPETELEWSPAFEAKPR
jgi:hypothetical protein